MAGPQGLSHLAYALLLPDFRHHGDIAAFCRRLTDQGFEMSGACRMVVTDAHFEALYPVESRPSSSDSTYRAFVSRRLLTMGPSTLLLLGKQGSADAQAELSAIKGHSDRRIGRPAQTLRAISALTDKSLSLLHTADDHDHFVGEFSVLTGLAPDKVSWDGLPLRTLEPRALAEMIGVSPEACGHPLEALSVLLRRLLYGLSADPRVPLSAEIRDRLRHTAAHCRWREPAGSSGEMVRICREGLEETADALAAARSDLVSLLDRFLPSKVTIVAAGWLAAIDWICSLARDGSIVSWEIASLAGALRNCLVPCSRFEEQVMTVGLAHYLAADPAVRRRSGDGSPFQTDEAERVR